MSHGTMGRVAGAAVVALLVGAGCGGGGGGGTEQRLGSSVIRTEWDRGEQFGHAFVNWVVKDPETLAPGACSFVGQLAIATEAGGLRPSAVDGPCIVTTQDLTLAGLEPDPAPACAGVLRLELGGIGRNVTVCDPMTFPAGIDLDCADVESSSMARVTSGPGEGDGDVLTMLDLSVPIAAKPNVTQLGDFPPAGDGTSVWPDGPLEIRWEPGPSVDADVSIEIDLSRASGVGETVRCFVDDDGEFTLPDSLVGSIRTGTAALSVARVTQARDTVDGFDFRVSSRTADGFQIFVRR